jgi:hypothetical protein
VCASITSGFDQIRQEDINGNARLLVNWFLKNVFGKSFTDVRVASQGFSSRAHDQFFSRYYALDWRGCSLKRVRGARTGQKLVALRLRRAEGRAEKRAERRAERGRKRGELRGQLRGELRGGLRGELSRVADKRALIFVILALYLVVVFVITKL